MEVERYQQRFDVYGFGKAFDLWSYPVYDIAVQLTLIEYNFYKVWYALMIASISPISVNKTPRVFEISLDEKERKEESAKYSRIYRIFQ